MNAIKVWFSVVDLTTGIRLAFHREIESTTDGALWAPSTPAFADMASLRERLCSAGLPEAIADSNASPLESYLVTESQLRHLGFSI
jgi:hypothetical protein